MNGRARIGLACATACLWVAVGCLGISDVDESSPSAGGGGAGTGGKVGDGAWPDGAGGSGGADGGTGGTTNPTGGTGGTGVSGGTGGTGVSGGTGGTGGNGGTVATGGTGGVGGAPSWKVYSYNLSQGTWAAPVALSTVWSGANAPPTSGIVAVTQLEHFDRLLVFADDGKYYVRVDGVWQAPVATTAAFPALAGLTLRTVYHVSSPPGTSPLGETITFVANPTAVLYKYNVTDTVSWLDTVTMKDEPLPGAPQGSGKALFDFELRDPAKHGAADYYLFYSGYSNGNLYQFDAAFVWKSWPMAQSPFWSGKSNAPPTAGLAAAWTNAAIGRVYVVGP